MDKFQNYLFSLKLLKIGISLLMTLKNKISQYQEDDRNISSILKNLKITYLYFYIYLLNLNYIKNMIYFY